MNKENDAKIIVETEEKQFGNGVPVPLVIACFSKHNEDAVSDINVEDWYMTYLENMQEIGGSEGHEIMVGTYSMLKALREGVKRGEILSIILEFDKVRYDCISLDGSIMNEQVPKALRAIIS